jgi:hypothetical protein
MSEDVSGNEALETQMDSTDLVVRQDKIMDHHDPSGRVSPLAYDLFERVTVAS